MSTATSLKLTLPRWCVPGSVTYDRAKRTATTIYLTDL